jgi:hypothetical protein
MMTDSNVETVLYSNASWEIVDTEYGVFLQPISRKWYFIPVGDLASLRVDAGRGGGDLCVGPLLHVSRKLWCIPSDFEDAVRAAVRMGLVTIDWDIDSKFETVRNLLVEECA